MTEFWHPYQLKDICEQITDGKHGDCLDEPNSGFYFLSAKDVMDGDLLYGSARQITQTDFTETHRRTKLAPNDILFTNSGTIGRMAIAKKNDRTERTTFQKSVAILKPKGSQVEPRFLYYVLRYDNSKLSDLAAGTAQKNLLLVHLRNFSVTLPSLPTQRKIAAVLSAYDDLIENNTRRIKILEDMAQMLYREWFIHFRFPGHEQSEMVESVLGPIPEGWTKASFSEIAHVISGGTPKTTEPSYWDGDIPFFTPKDSPASVYVLDTEKNVTQEGLLKCSSKLFPKDTVFITARGTVGKMAMPASDMAMNQSCYALQGRGGISQYFLFMALQESVKELKQAATGAVFDTIVVDSLSRLHFAKPPEKLVEKWTDAATPIFRQLLALIKKNAVLRQTRDLLLPKLISGEVDVTEAEIVGSGE